MTEPWNRPGVHPEDRRGFDWAQARTRQRDEERKRRVSDPKLKVGDKLWFVPSARHWGLEEEYAVRSVGRRWAAIAPLDWKRDRFRVDMKTLLASADGTSSPGQAYRDRAAYEALKAADTAWDTLRCNLNWRRPEHLTADDIAEIAARIAGPKGKDG